MASTVSAATVPVTGCDYTYDSVTNTAVDGGVSIAGAHVSNNSHESLKEVSAVGALQQQLTTLAEELQRESSLRQTLSPGTHKTRRIVQIL